MLKNVAATCCSDVTCEVATQTDDYRTETVDATTQTDDIQTCQGLQSAAVAELLLCQICTLHLLSPMPG